MNRITFKLTRAGVIASLYIVLSFITFPVSGGAIQFRISEGLTLLPLLYIESVPALALGCLIFNALSGLAVYDVLLGSLITLVSGVLTYLVGKFIKQKVLAIIVGGFFPIVLNALFLPVIWLFLGEGLEYVYLVQVGFLLISQALSIYLFGTIIYTSTYKLKSKNLSYFT